MSDNAELHAQGFSDNLLCCRFAQAGCLFGGEVPETLLHKGAVNTSQVGRIHSDDTPDLLKTGAFLEQIVGISPDKNTHTLRTQVCLQESPPLAGYQMSDLVHLSLEWPIADGSAYDMQMPADHAEPASGA